MQAKALENGFTFIDSEQRAKDNPETWGHPGPEALRLIEVGCYVKIGVSQSGRSGERFWGVVMQRIGQEFFVQIDQDLRLTAEHGLRDEDIVVGSREEHIRDCGFFWNDDLGALIAKSHCGGVEACAVP